MQGKLPSIFSFLAFFLSLSTATKLSVKIRALEKQKTLQHRRWPAEEAIAN